MATREELEQKINKLEVNMNRTDRIVNGGEDEDVLIDGGQLVPSIRKWQKELGEEYGFPQELVQQAEDAADRAEEAADRVLEVYSYTSGLELASYNQLIRDSNGEFWRVSGQVELPYTTTGAGIPEDDALVPAGDAVIRQDLANPDKGAAMVARGVVAVDSIADLLALPEGQRKEGLRYLVKGYHVGTDVGGGEFYYDSSRVNENDGGSALDGFIRKLNGRVCPTHFGARPGAVGSDVDAFKRLAGFIENNPHEVHVNYPHLLDGTVVIRSPNKWVFSGAGEIVNSAVRPDEGNSGLFWRASDAPAFSADLSEDVLAGADEIPVAAAGVEVGDLLIIRSDNILSDTREITIYDAETTIVSGVTGTSLGVYPEIYRDYLVSDNARIEVWKPISGLRLVSPKFTNQGGAELIGARVQHFIDLKVSDAMCAGGLKGLFAQIGVDGVFEDCTAIDVSERLGYGLEFESTRNAHIIRPKGYGCRHLTEISGFSINTEVICPTGSPGSASVYSWHPGPERNTISGAVMGAGYIFMRGQINAIRDSELLGSSYIELGEVQANPTPITRARSGEGLTIERVKFRGIGEPGYKIRSVHPIMGGKINDCVIDLDTTTINSLLWAWAGMAGLEVSDNRLLGGYDLLTSSNNPNIDITHKPDHDSGVVFSRNRGEIIRDVFRTTTPGDGLWVSGVKFHNNEITFTGSVGRVLNNTNTNRHAVDVEDILNTWNNLFQFADQSGSVDWGSLVVVGEPPEHRTTASGGTITYTTPIGRRSSISSPSIYFASAPGYVVIPDTYGESGGLHATQSFKVYLPDGTPAGNGVQVTIQRLR